MGILVLESMADEAGFPEFFAEGLRSVAGGVSPDKPTTCDILGSGGIQ